MGRVDESEVPLMRIQSSEAVRRGGQDRIRRVHTRMPDMDNPESRVTPDRLSGRPYDYSAGPVVEVFGSRTRL